MNLDAGFLVGKSYLQPRQIVISETPMSIKEFVTELQDKHKEDLHDILDLLKILKGLQKEEQEVYEIIVTINL